MAINPESFEAEFWRGVRLRESGELATALEAAMLAVELEPGNAPAHASLGDCRSLLRQHQEAVECFRRAIELDPACAVFQHNLAIELETLSRVDEAITAYRSAIELDPCVPNSFVSLGKLLMARHASGEAAECFRKARAAVPDTAEGFYRLARCFFDEGFAEEAEECLQRAVELKPTDALAHALHGTVQLQLGRFDSAIESLERAIELVPATPQPYTELVGARRTQPDHQPLLNRMATMLQEPSLPLNDRRSLHYALGKAYDDLGEYGRAMRHFDEANAIMTTQLAGRRLDRLENAASFTKMLETFDERTLSRPRNLGVQSEMPILIVGMIRSGTTLVEQIVSSHPSVAAGGELTFMLGRYQAVLNPPSGSSPPNEAAKLAADYLELLRSIGEGKAHVTDKMPHNFLLLGLVHLIFPNARIIHCRRHPVDTCLSIYTTPYPQPLNFGHDRAEIVFFYRQYQRITEHWRRVLPADRYLEIDYEALVSDREKVTRQMIEFCGLEWEDACLHHEQNEGAIRTPSWWQARQPIYTRSKERWRNYEPWLGDFRDLFET